MKIFLVIAYISMFGEESIKKADFTKQGYSACLREASRKYATIHAGSGRIWCAKVIERKHREN